MTDETHQEEQKQSYILIRFADIGSVVFNAQMDNVTPMQLLAIAGWLELRAKNGLIQMESQRAEEEAKKSIARPKLVLPGQD